MLVLHHDKDPEDGNSIKIAFNENKILTWPRITTLTSLRGVNLDQEYMLPTLESGKRGKNIKS